ncbi:unnamed protein product [Trypanosoma congolense IL3000]|uniref:WGS project CAEQ00000000 data, annotated contig 1214 n=1 Tax=Trypanosoma congolense (strain IL3000) TaxID=1068625 RepID=F9W4Q1_TRYCI|nr:unnamed protein product [Trypanosoma congolense IL3000]
MRCCHIQQTIALKCDNSIKGESKHHEALRWCDSLEFVQRHPAGSHPPRNRSFRIMPRELAALIYFLHLQPLDWHNGRPKHHAGRFGGVHNFSHLPSGRISRAGKVLLSFSIGAPHPNEELVTCKGLGQISRHFLLMLREAASDSDVTVWQPLSPIGFRFFAFWSSACTWRFSNALASFGF